jgi:hypothetical protein
MKRGLGEEPGKKQGRYRMENAPKFGYIYIIKYSMVLD